MSERFPILRDFFQLGKSLKSHGTSGLLRVLVEDRHVSYLKPGTFLFFDINGTKVPYKITSMEEGAHRVVALESIDNKKLSDQLSGLPFSIPLNTVRERDQRSPRNLLDKWDEYKITDTATGKEFVVLRVEEFPQQLMAVVSWGSKEVLIPLSDQLISSIDKAQKVIHMEIPAGLLDL